LILQLTSLADACRGLILAAGAVMAVFSETTICLASDASPPLAPAALVLTAGEKHQPLRDALEFFDDPSGTLTIDTVAGQTFHRGLVTGFTEGTHWYRFTVVRPAEVPQVWILAMGQPTIIDIRVFTPTADHDPGWKETRAGRGQRGPEGTLITPDLQLRLDLPADRPQTFYVRLASPMLLAFHASLWRPEALITEQVGKSAIASLHLGILTAVTLVFAILGVWARIGSLMAYAAYCAATAMTLLALTGLHAVLFPGMDAEIGVRLLMGGGLTAGLAALVILWDLLLDLKWRSPRLHRLYLGVAILMLLSLLSLFSPFYGRMVTLLIAGSLVIGLLTLGLITRVICKAKTDALYHLYGAAQIAFIASTGDKLAWSFGWVGPEPTLLPELAGLTHLVILSIAIALRMSRIVAAGHRAEVQAAELNIRLTEQRNMLAMASHQLRTPLAVIAAASGVLEVCPDRRDEVAKIQQAVLRMRTFTADLLSENRLDQSASAMTMERFDLLPLLRELGDERQRISRRAVRLIAPQQPAVIEGDRVLLSVLFANLLDNAIAYSPPTGEIRIEVACAAQAVTVVVADQGPGIALADAGHVFEKFYRSPGASGKPGFGLGLYLVRGIAERHGGQVRLASSSPEPGTRIVVTLPYRAAAPADPMGIGDAAP